MFIIYCYYNIPKSFLSCTGRTNFGLHICEKQRCLCELQDCGIEEFYRAFILAAGFFAKEKIKGLSQVEKF